MRRLLGSAVGLCLLALLVFGLRSLWIAAHVGAGYAAKVTCSLAFNSGQDPAALARGYLSRELAPLGSMVRTAVTADGAEARAFGLVRARAFFRRGLGCTLVPDGDAQRLAQLPTLDRPRRDLDPALPWPEGGAGVATPPSPEVQSAIEKAFREPYAADPGRVRETTAVVVAHDGHLVAERYAPGYGPDNPMLSWSMAKSVLATVVGSLVAEGRIDLRAPAPVPEWADPSDPRHAITLDQLLRMSSGLAFDEHYGAINDVSRMLFTQPDTAAFAAAMPLAGLPDTLWSYSSGTSNVVGRVVRKVLGGEFGALVRYADEHVFDPVGMTSAFFEPDESGTPIASSFVFMTARDWARLGELHRRDGVWNGRRILPAGWVKYVTTPTPRAPDGRYGAHWWLNAGAPEDRSRRMWPGLPTDVYAAKGHSGQAVVVVPSARLVVVRLGLSSTDEGNDGVAELVADLLRALS